MRKLLLCMLLISILSCSSDDDSSGILENSISFNLNGVDYVLTEYVAQINPTNNVNRMVEASFDNGTKRIVFTIPIEGSTQIEQFLFQMDGVNRLTDGVIGGPIEAAITTHTDTKMEGTFTIIMEDTLGEPAYSFTNGIINIQY